MNLITRITVLFVLVSLLVFAIGGVISFRILMREVEYEQQRFLLERLERVERRIERIQPSDTLRWNKMIAVPVAREQEERLVFSDTLVMHAQLERMEPHLKLDAIRTVGSASFRIILYDVIIEEDDIKDGLIESLTTMYLILLGAVLLIGLIASFVILRPFNVTLSEIKKFSLKEPDQQSSFPKSKVSEFKRLNTFLEEMTNKVRSDYRSLKEFSENASHEFQTPIAIIQSKLEVLMDDGQLDENQIDQLGSIQRATRRLSNLSHSLALLTKIENNEFANVSPVNVSSLLSSLLEEFKELVELKGLKMDEAITDNIFLDADQVLIELLLTNLINNAIRHNMSGGSVQIELTPGTFNISNTGPELRIDPEELFRRFKKSNQSDTSMGLGLAIVKKICDFYGYQANYHFSNGFHTIQISFDPLKQSE